MILLPHHPEYRGVLMSIPWEFVHKFLRMEVGREHVIMEVEMTIFALMRKLRFVHALIIEKREQSPAVP